MCPSLRMDSVTEKSVADPRRPSRGDSQLGGADLPLHRAVRLQPAGLRVSELDLQGRMADAEAVFQPLDKGCKRGIPRVPAGHHQMRRQRGLRRAHRPDVQVVSTCDTGQSAKACAHLGRVDA